MRRETKLLLSKAYDSILLGIELFNRPQDRGRASGVLIQIDHGFEMFLKAAIVHRGGLIREPDAKETIGFKACVGRGLSDGKVKFLTKDQALTLQAINSLRDSVQHYLSDISEGQLYIHIQSAITLFRDLLSTVFQRDLLDELPNRVLPISTSPPTDLMTIFDSEITEILKLLSAKRRRYIEAEARLRPLAILDSTIMGQEEQPSAADLKRLGRELSKKPWNEVFASVPLVDVVTDGVGPTISIRLTKREGAAIHIVPEGTPGTYPAAVKRVNELDFYNLGAKQLAYNVGLTVPKLVAVVAHLGIQNDKEYFKEITIGTSHHKLYSQKAIPRIRECLKNESMDDIWKNRPKSMRNPSKSGQSTNPGRVA